MSAREQTKVADLQSFLRRRGKPRAYLLFGHKLMEKERLMSGKGGQRRLHQFLRHAATLRETVITW